MTLTPPEHGGDPVPLRDVLRLARVSDESLHEVVEAWAGRWESTANAILEYGEEGLVEGFVSEQATAVLLLARSVRQLERERGDITPDTPAWPGLVAELDEVNQKLQEARAWARGFEHGMFVGVDTDHPPEWLTAPLDEGL